MRGDGYQVGNTIMTIAKIDGYNFSSAKLQVIPANSRVPIYETEATISYNHITPEWTQLGANGM